MEQLLVRRILLDISQTEYYLTKLRLKTFRLYGLKFKLCKDNALDRSAVSTWPEMELYIQDTI